MIHFKLILFFTLFSLKMSAQCPVFWADSEAILSDSESTWWTGDETNCELEKPKHPLSIYPNPTSDYFEVKNWTNTEGYLFDAVGRLVRIFDSRAIVDVSNLPSGIYIIRVDNQVFKIIKIN